MNAHIVDIDDPRLVKALAHPIRMKILSILDEKTATPKELAALLGLPLENVSYHVRTLKDFGFIKLEKTRQVRGAVEHHYRLAAAPRIGNKLWEEIPRVVQEALLDANLNVIVESIGQAAQQGGVDRGESHVVRHTLTLDEDGLKEVSGILSDAEDRIAAVEEKARKRLKGRNGDDALRFSAAWFLFETPALASGKSSQSRRRRPQKSGV